MSFHFCSVACCVPKYKPFLEKLDVLVRQQAFFLQAQADRQTVDYVRKLVSLTCHRLRWLFVWFSFVGSRT